MGYCNQGAEGRVKEEIWCDWWMKKSTQRWNKLAKEDRLETQLLFHEKMNEIDLENWLGARGVG